MKIYVVASPVRDGTLEYEYHSFHRTMWSAKQKMAKLYAEDEDYEFEDEPPFFILDVEVEE